MSSPFRGSISLVLGAWAAGCLAAACSGGAKTDPGAGGTAASGAASGTISSGGRSGSGGTTASGGSESGGAGTSTGGAPSGTGGGPSATGGRPISTGGVGGTPASGGAGDRNGTGGGGSGGSGGRAGGTGGSPAGSGGAAAGSGGATPGNGCSPAVGIPYSYACWPMPNPPALGLPHPASYTDGGDGTVKDNVTNLIWQKSVASTQAFTWDGAKSYCAALTLAGRAWRLPTRIELLSIVDFTRTSPALDVAVFPNTPGGKYHWTASPWVVSQLSTKPQYSWIVNFYEGLTSNAGDRTALEFARCVSSSQMGPLPTLYTQVAPGEIQDNLTGLIWQQASSTAAVAFADAAAVCTALALNGHGWRLPSIKELSTLVNETPPITKVSPAIDTVQFPDTPANGAYWSSSLFNSQPATAHNPWVINFTDGFTQSSLASARVKCVR